MIILRGVSQAALQGLLLLLMTGLVTVFYERGYPADMALMALECWIQSLMPCREAHRLCFNSSIIRPQNHTGWNTTEWPCPPQLRSPYYYYTHEGPIQVCELFGQSPEYERRPEEEEGLFSMVGVPFLLLCSQVLATAFFLCYIRQDSADDSHSSSSNLQKSLKRMALLVQIVFAGCFLFVQNTWKIPGNNLFLGELLLLISLLYISFYPSSHYSQYARHKYTPMRFLEFAFTLPLLSVGAVAASGLTNMMDMNWVFYASLFMNLFLWCLELRQYHTRVENTEDNMEGAAVILLNAWLCCVAFLLECSLVIEQALAVQQRGWAIAGVVLVVLYHVVYLVGVTVFHMIDQSREHHLYFVHFLDAVSLGGKFTVCLSIMGGAISGLEP